MDGIKESIRNNISITDVIASYVTLIPFGNNYKACCPFHHEKTPSFHVTPEKNMFYCFGCKKGGDIFTFIQEIEHVDFREALKILAEKSGISMDQSQEISEEVFLKKRLMTIHEYATRFYQIILSKNNAVMEYITGRGISRESIKKWRIGFATDGFSGLTDVLIKKSFSKKELIQSGLVVDNEGRIYDRFRGRILFPFTDNFGKPIGFSGRLFSGSNESKRENVGKYINSPETILYHKSKNLFGFSHAKQEISKKSSVILVEGQFDCILSHQVGHGNTVAISGTACTDFHIEQLTRFAQEIIIATDSDDAGIKSAHSIARIAYQFDVNVSLIILPSGKDPADMIIENPLDWNNAVAQRKDYLAFFSEMTHGQPLRSRLQTVKETLFPSLVAITHHIYRDEKLHRIAQMLHVSDESIRTEFQQYKDDYDNKKENNQEPTPIIENNQKNSAKETQILEISMLHHHFQDETKDWFTDHPEALEYVASLPENYHLYEHMFQYKNLDKETLIIKLNTLWVRLQQLLIEEKIESIKQKISQVVDTEISQKMQQELLALRIQKEKLIYLLSE